MGFPTEREIQDILARYVDVGCAVGAIAGLTGPEGRKIVSYGSLEQDGSGPLNGDTVFEIGCITKVFTALLMAEMVSRREIDLHEPIKNYLPKTVRLHERGRSVTFADLASHTSGLPEQALPSEFNEFCAFIADYTSKTLYEFLAECKPLEEPGGQARYGSTGSALLGHILSLRANEDYENLLLSRILNPLGLTSTGITYTHNQKKRMAPGHTPFLESAPFLPPSPILGCASELHSSANDLLDLLDVALGINPSPLNKHFNFLLTQRYPMDIENQEMALGWTILKTNGSEIAFHCGSAPGHVAFLGFSPDKRIGAVVFSNMGGVPGIMDIGAHLLDPRHTLEKLFPE